MRVGVCACLCVWGGVCMSVWGGGVCMSVCGGGACLCVGGGCVHVCVWGVGVCMSVCGGWVCACLCVGVCVHVCVGGGGGVHVCVFYCWGGGACLCVGGGCACLCVCGGGVHVCVFYCCGGWRWGGVFVCVCAYAHMYGLRIVWMDKILHFTITLIIYYLKLVSSRIQYKIQLSSASTLSLVQLLRTSLSCFISTLFTLFARPQIFCVPRMGRRTLGERSFQCIRPVAWNSLPLCWVFVVTLLSQNWKPTSSLLYTDLFLLLFLFFLILPTHHQ